MYTYLHMCVYICLTFVGNMLSFIYVYVNYIS